MTPLDVVRVIEQHADGTVTHEAHITLTDTAWRQLVGDVAARFVHLRANGHPVLRRMLAAGHRPACLTQQDALTDLVTMLTGPTHRGSAHTLPPLWEVTPDEATELAHALDDAAQEPAVCGCGSVVHQPSDLTTTCGQCVDRLGGDR